MSKFIVLQDGRKGWLVQTPDALLLELQGEGGLCVPVTCSWFVMCDNKAVTTKPHAILGDVPICAGCAAKVTRLECA